MDRAAILVALWSSGLLPAEVVARNWDSDLDLALDFELPARAILGRIFLLFFGFYSLILLLHSSAS